MAIMLEPFRMKISRSDMWARCKVMQETEKGFSLFLPCVNHKEEVRRAGNMLVVDIPDPRIISRDQQKKAHVLIGYIADWYGGTPLEVEKVILKEIFKGSHEEIAENFSLADCSVEEARLFISWLIDFCLLHGIYTGVPMYELADDIPRYVWACLMNKRCAVCGRKADLHHVDAVGSGRNRNTIHHAGMMCLPLCREHHTELHKTGQKTFCKKYFLEPVPIDEKIAKVYRLRY